MMDAKALANALRSQAPQRGGQMGRNQLYGGASGIPTLNQAAIGLSTVPVLGDIAGLAADANMYKNDPESHSWANYGMSAAGLLPFVPGAAMVKALKSAPEQLFTDANRLTNLDPNGGMMQAIRSQNQLPATGKVKVYRATVGNQIRPNDFVAINPDIAAQHMDNLADRGEVGRIITQEVDLDDLLMGNDATEFIYNPRSRK